jgi:hypothetical protein
MNTDMPRRALAARDAHLALIDLRRVVDEAAQTTHAAELEAVHLARAPESMATLQASCGPPLRGWVQMLFRIP